MKNLVIALLLSSLFVACKNNETKPADLPKPMQTVNLVQGNDTTVNLEVASEIIYDVKVKAHKTDDDWTQECLKNTSPEALSNLIFDAIYAQKLDAYDYFTDEKLNLEAIKAFEKEYERNRIGQLQFIEDWYFDNTNLKFYKKVKGLMMAYERYKEDGSVKNYKAGIKVLFK
jgi:hypothetical protein